MVKCDIPNCPSQGVHPNRKRVRHCVPLRDSLPIIAAPLKYSDAAIWFSDLCRLKLDSGMESMEEISSKRCIFSGECATRFDRIGLMSILSVRFLHSS